MVGDCSSETLKCLAYNSLQGGTIAEFLDFISRVTGKEIIAMTDWKKNNGKEIIAILVEK